MSSPAVYLSDLFISERALLLVNTASLKNSRSSKLQVIIDAFVLVFQPQFFRKFLRWLRYYVMIFI